MSLILQHVPESRTLVKGEKAVGNKEGKAYSRGKFSPRAIAHAILLFPVPLGPIIILRYGPGKNWT
jgi:hypothetical protein